MLLVFPVASFLIFFKIFRRSSDWREALLAASIFWGACVVLITETLSVPRLIERGPVAIFWFAICLAGVACLLVKRPENRYADRVSHPPPCAVLCLDCADVPQKWAEYRKLGGKASVFDDIVIFR